MASYTTNLNLKKPAGSENVAIGDINNNMDTIDQAYGTLNSNKWNKPTIIRNHTNIISSTSLSYTGLSVSIPANSNYAINFALRFSNSAPQEILISTSQTSMLPYQVYAHSESGVASVSGRTDSAITLYLWGRYNGETENGVLIDGWYSD